MFFSQVVVVLLTTSPTSPRARQLTDDHAADDPGTVDGAVNHGDGVRELLLENAVEVFGRAERHKAVPRKRKACCACVVMVGSDARARCSQERAGI